MENNVLIFGHKSPDTDTIMSSMIMENLEKKLGNVNAKAVRLGEVNKETLFRNGCTRISFRNTR